MIPQSTLAGDVEVINNETAILKSTQLNNTAAKIPINISKIQGHEVRVGMTSVCILVVELLRGLYQLVSKSGLCYNAKHWTRCVVSGQAHSPPIN